MSERASDPNVLALAPIVSAWQSTLAALAAGFVALTALHFSTVTSAVHLWNSSSAYNYAYLIGPISAALVWAERHALARAIPQPSAWGIAIAGASSAAWLASDLLGLDEGRHFAFVGMMQGLAFALIGWRLYRFLAFPLLYLFFLVPTGTFLLSPLQTIAHAANVALLKASGVPVFSEGFLIQVPAGSFLVEPGCAGLNFFIVALALSLLYGRLCYGTTFARIVCVIVALAAAVIANILRIYLIIGLAQATERKIDITADHLLYGWGFFSVVMLAVMWAGTKTTAVSPGARVLPIGPQEPLRGRRTAAMLAGVLLVVAISSLLAATSSARAALESQAWVARAGIAGRVGGE